MKTTFSGSHAALEKWRIELEDKQPAWLRDSDLAGEALEVVCADFGHEKAEAIRRQLTLLNIIARFKARREPGPDGALDASVRKMAKSLGEATARFQKFLGSPLVFLAPAETLRFANVLTSGSDSVIHFFSLLHKRGAENTLRAEISMSLQKGKKVHNDKLVGELIALASFVPTRTVSRKKFTSRIDADERKWRLNSAAAQKQWRRSHARLLLEAQERRSRSALLALRNLASSDQSGI